MRINNITLLAVILLSACKTVPSENIVQTTTPKNTISILSGKKVFFEAIIKNQIFTRFIQVEKITKPEITLTFNFMEMNENKSVMLSVKNPFNKSIKYHINMIDYVGKAHQTSSCPISAGLSVYENWGHPIPKLEISNMHFSAESEKGLCIY
jgi:hypothetical protein